MVCDFWNNRRVLITGHTGFKGSWLAIWLKNMGAQVFGFALLPPTTPNLFEVAQVANGMMSSTIADCRNFSSFQNTIKQAEPEIIFHLAAQSLVKRSYRDPIETYSSNIMGTVHLFEAVRATPSVKAVINITSDKCYENREWIWGYRENDPMGGFDPYSSSKGCVELISSSYRAAFFSPARYNEHGVALATARAGNVIGGGDWSEDRLLPDLFRALDCNQPIHVRNPNATRPWQHVLDPLSGYLLLAEKLVTEGTTYAEAWNFGPDDGNSQPVRWIVEYMMKERNKPQNWCKIVKDNNQPHEANYLKLDVSKAKARLAWYPRWGLVEALDSTVAWHHAWLAKEDMNAYCLEQIKQFEKNETGN